MILKSKNKNFTNINDLVVLVVSNKVSFGKKGFKYFIGYKDAKLDLYVYFSQEWTHTEKTLMKLNICLFWLKMMNY